MRRRFAGDAEVVGGLDEAGAEHFLPEAVDRDAGRQRVALVEEPLREAEAVPREGCRHRRQGGRDGRLYLFFAADRTCRD